MLVVEEANHTLLLGSHPGLLGGPICHVLGGGGGEWADGAQVHKPKSSVDSHPFDFSHPTSPTASS